MKKLIAALITSSSLAGCVTTQDAYCLDIGRKWGEAKYSECRMVQALTMGGSRPAIDVYLH